MSSPRRSAPRRRDAAGKVWILLVLLLPSDVLAETPEPDRAQGPSAQARVGDPLPVADLRLPDVLGVEHSLEEYATGKRLVVTAFLGTECPLARHYGRRLSEMANRYAQEVSFVGVMSNRQDTIEKIKHYAAQHDIEFDLLKDQANRAADRFAATRTPEIIVRDAAGVVRYRGRIDDQYGVGFVRGEATTHDLRDAIESLLRGESPAVSETEVVGCLIGRVTEPDPESPVTYRRHVAPLLAKHCVECHRPGEIGPFSLTSYEDAVGWAPTLEEVVRQGRMPPWHAAEGGLPLTNTRKMTDQEKQTLYDWVEHGAPEGDGPLPELARQPVNPWGLPREPDLIVPMAPRPFQVPATGVVEYQYFVADPGLKEDAWVAAASVRPGDRSVLHHAIVFVRPPDDYQGPRSDIGLLTGFVPGQSFTPLPPHQARLIPAGSLLVFQMHYTPNGAPSEDLSELGIVFAEESQVTEQVITSVGINREFEIPPGDGAYDVELNLRQFPASAKILALAPHMHLRGKAFRFERNSPGEGRELLLSVPAYDFNWQHTYYLRDPLPAEVAGQARCVVTFDNSEDNLVNPDPTQAVRWGDQTWQEMALAYFVLAVPREEVARRAAASSANEEQRRLAAAERQADDLLRRFDRNSDGVIQRREAPAAFSVFAFFRHDDDNDNKLTREEIIRGVLSRK